MITRIFTYCPKDGTVCFTGEKCPHCGAPAEPGIIVGGAMILSLTPDGVRELYEEYVKPFLPAEKET